MPLKGATFHIAVLLVVAVLFGGGGSGAALANLAVQLCALGVLALHPQAVIGFFRRAPRVPVILVAVSLALPLLQSIPLPPVLWHNLPGREPARETFNFMGQPGAWMPFSLEWHRTLIAFLALLPPFTVLVLVWDMRETNRRRLMIVLVALGVFMVLLGTQQLVGGNRRFMFFDEAEGSRYLVGTFAGHSPAGLFLILALCALAGVFPRHPDTKWVIGGASVAILLATGILLGRSRSAMVLLSIPLALAALRFAGTIGQTLLRTRRMVAISAGIVTLVVAGLVVVGQSERVQQGLARFGDLSDSRPLIWQDTLGTFARYWPVGSGIGTFDEVFQLDETLENITPPRAARAHNDFLEVGVESGFAGLLLTGSWIIFMIVCGFKSRRSKEMTWAATAGVAAVALQSISDFPLRNQTLLCIAGFLLAILIDKKQSVSASSEGRQDIGCGTH